MSLFRLGDDPLCLAIKHQLVDEILLRSIIPANDLLSRTSTQKLYHYCFSFSSLSQPSARLELFRETAKSDMEKIFIKLTFLRATYSLFQIEIRGETFYFLVRATQVYTVSEN